MAFIITAAKVCAHHRIIENGQILVNGGTIVAVGERVSCPGAEVIDLGSASVIPGLIDLHIHGCGGHDAMDATPQALEGMSHTLAQCGVTAFSPVVMTSHWENVLNALDVIQHTMKKPLPGAALLGAYVEGPFFSSSHRGAHPAGLLKGIDMEAIRELVAQFCDTIKVFALAPELIDAEQAITYLLSNNIKTALGHSNATYAEAIRAIDLGADLAVHVFNGMRSLHHREPGIVGAVLQDPRAYVELIADGVHLHPAILDLVVRAKGVDRVCLVSDSMRAAGLPDGTYDLGETRVVVDKSVAKTPDGALAGSTAKLIDCVRNVTRYAGLDMLTAVHMASLNPARYLGVDHSMGSIAPGKLANLAVINEDFSVLSTVIAGKFYRHMA